MDLTFPLKSTFLALPLENQPKWQFQAYQQSLEPFKDILSFQNPQSPHLTLYFFQELMEIEYHQVIDQATKIAANTSQFAIKVTGADTFGNRGEDRVLFFTIAFSDELARVKKACPWPNLKPFEPHITIARIKHPQKFAVQKKKILKEVQDASFEIPLDRLRLYSEINHVKQTQIGEFLFNKD